MNDSILKELKTISDQGKVLESKMGNLEQKLDDKFQKLEERFNKKFLEQDERIDKKFEIFQRYISEQFITLKFDIVGDLRVYLDQRVTKLTTHLLGYINDIYEARKAT